MIRDCGAQLIEIGHAERRQYFGETDLTVNRKVRAALEHRLRPLICVGETAQEKEAGNAESFVSFQVKAALHEVPADQINNVLFAYEPVWAIGKHGMAADPGYTNQIHALIRQTVADLYGKDTAEAVAVLYGGSVSRENANTFIEQPQIDGLFIGRSSWQVNNFVAIIQMVEDFLHSTRPLT
jgi:triosephosphate isomerase